MAEAEEIQERILVAARKSLAQVPKYNGRTSFALWRQAWTTWVIGQGIDRAGHRMGKISILTAMEGRALAMVEPLQSSTTAFAEIATVEEFMERVQLLFQPAAEIQMAKEQFKSCKQARQENVSSYLSRKFGFFDRAFSPAERIFDNLLDEVISGLYSNLVKRKMRWENPRTREAIREKALYIVATERRALAEGYGESVSYDGLAATTITFSQNEDHQYGEPMDIDKIDEDVNRLGNPQDRKCYTCQGIGHLARQCPTKKQGNPPNRGGGGGGRGRGNKTGGTGGFRGKCNGCHQVGHMIKNCPSKGGRGRGGRVDPGKGAQRTPPNRGVNKVEDEENTGNDPFLAESILWEESE